jgi:hypothetical protein
MHNACKSLVALQVTALIRQWTSKIRRLVQSDGKQDRDYPGRCNVKCVRHAIYLDASIEIGKRSCQAQLRSLGLGAKRPERIPRAIAYPNMKPWQRNRRQDLLLCSPDRKLVRFPCCNGETGCGFARRAIL